MPAKENDTLPSSASGSFSSSYSKFSAPSSPSMYLQPSDLMDQLKNSPETRFHAAWMFLRYFYLTMSPDLNMDTGTRNNARNLSRQSSLNSNASASTNLERRDHVIWDIAIACLALSVKVSLLFLVVTSIADRSWEVPSRFSEPFASCLCARISFIVSSTFVVRGFGGIVLLNHIFNL